VQKDSQTQSRIFLASEADEWFRRNAAALKGFDLAKDPPATLIREYGLRPRRILEVGAANGARVAALCAEYGARGTAIEPSAAAVEDARARFPDIKVERGLSHELPTDETYDLVIISAVFHWVDRSLLLATVAEIDRVLDDGGYLVVADFFPHSPMKNAYEHVDSERMYTYKQDYSAVFRASGVYLPVGSALSEHGGTRSPAPAENDRWGVWLLRKDLDQAYAERSWSP
jgi:SAM-dependent methyltransferase